MRKSVYKALAAFYTANTQNTGAKRVTHRLMILPEGVIGVDAMVASEVIDDSINNASREMITYRFVTNSKGSVTCTQVGLTIAEWYSGFEKLGKNDIISIVCLGLNGVPDIDEIRDVTEDTTHPIRLTDIYCGDGMSHPYDTEDDEYCSGAAGMTDEMDMVAEDEYISYGDVPVSILSHFLRKHVRKGERFPSYKQRLGIKSLAHATRVSEGHIYAKLMGVEDVVIRATEWADEEIKTADLFDGNLLRKSLDPVLVHYMVYNYMHREDPTDAKYIKAVHMYITDHDKYSEEILGTIEPMVVHETQILRDTLFKIVYNIEVVTKPFTACTVNGKPLVFSPPVIVEYKTDIDNPMPYEGVACDYLKRAGYVEIADENINSIKTIKYFSADVYADSIILRTWKNMNPSEYEDEAPNSQKIEAIIARDSNAESNKMIIRIQDSELLMDAFYDLLADDNGRKHFIRVNSAPAEYMLTDYDIIYDGSGSPDSDEPDEEDEDDDDDDDWDEDDWD